MTRATALALDFADQIDAKFAAQNGKAGYPADHFVVIPGKVYDKIAKSHRSGGTSVHAFVDRQTGALYKAAGWASPAKGTDGKPQPRYDLSTPEGFVQALQNADQFGSYLYADYQIKA